MWYIKSEGLKGGDPLMPERELAEKLGVSRTALRAAITQLISTHVLESRQGSGTYVLPPKPINIFQEITTSPMPSAEPVESPDRISCTPV